MAALQILGFGAGAKCSSKLFSLWHHQGSFPEVLARWFVPPVQGVRLKKKKTRTFSFLFPRAPSSLDTLVYLERVTRERNA